MKRMGGRETEKYLGKKKKIKKRSGLHKAISFVMYFLIFDCLAAEKTMGETFRSGLVFLVFLFKKLLDLNSCEFRFLIIFLFFYLVKINKLTFLIYMLMCHG